MCLGHRVGAMYNTDQAHVWFHLYAPRHGGSFPTHFFKNVEDSSRVLGLLVTALMA